MFVKQNSTFSALTTFIWILTINLLIWGKALLKFVPNGDDILEILGAHSYFSDFPSKILNFSGQYRPLGRLFYGMYFPFVANFSALYFFHLLHFTLAQYLFYLYASTITRKIQAFIVMIFVFYNPIMYYHIFAIASDINLMILMILIISILLIHFKRNLWVMFLFFLSMFIKETFIAMIPIALYSVYESTLHARNKLYCYLSILSTSLLYVVIRFYYYVPIAEEYRFVFTFQKAIVNIAKICALLLNFGVSSRNPFVFDHFFMLGLVLSVCIGILWILGIFYTFKKSFILSIVLTSIALCGIAPFVTLSKIALYDLDIPFLVLGLLILQAISKKKSLLIPLLLVFSLFLSYFLFFHDWINNSFVGNSNIVSINFINTIKQVDVENSKNLCIINHSWGWWPTASGDVIHFVYPNYSGHVLSTNEDNTSKCEKGIVYRNLRQGYTRLEDKN